MAEALYHLNDNILELLGLKDELTGEWINDAIVTVTLTDEITGSQVVGGIWPQAMPYVASSNGNYRAVLDSALAVSLGQRLVASIAVDAGAGGKAAWQHQALVKPRRS